MTTKTSLLLIFIVMQILWTLYVVLPLCTIVPRVHFDPTTWSNFLKKLRYHCAKQKLSIRCVYAGEYGDKHKRPHYHLIIWGLPYQNRDLIFKSWINKQKKLMCDPKRLDVQIPKNDRHVANYLGKYLLSDKKRAGHPSLKGAYPEFYRTSKGLGLDYAKGVAAALTKESGLINLWLAGTIPSNFFFDGKNFPLDRYMKGKIYELLPPVFKEELPKAALEDYKLEMYNMYETALMDEEFAKEAMTMSMESAMELAVTRNNARRALEIETRHNFFNTKRSNIDV